LFECDVPILTVHESETYVPCYRGRERFKVLILDQVYICAIILSYLHVPTES